MNYWGKPRLFWERYTHHVSSYHIIPAGPIYFFSLHPQNSLVSNVVPSTYGLYSARTFLLYLRWLPISPFQTLRWSSHRVSAWGNYLHKYLLQTPFYRNFQCVYYLQQHSVDSFQRNRCNLQWRLTANKRPRRADLHPEQPQRYATEVVEYRDRADQRASCIWAPPSKTDLVCFSCLHRSTLRRWKLPGSWGLAAYGCIIWKGTRSGLRERLLSEA